MDAAVSERKQAKAMTAREKLLEAALLLIRTKGYAATTVDDLCAAAGVTKGAFFHHFASKEALGVGAAEYWSEMTGAVFAAAPYHRSADPLQRILGYIDFRKRKLSTARVPEFTCLVGTMVQEVYDSSPAIRDACDASISSHAATLEPDIAEAMARYGVRGDWTARSLALHIQAVLQGAYVLAKAKGNGAIAADSIDHLRRYLVQLFGTDRGAAKPSRSAKEQRR
jgi:TetR/AcrR family transcriptional regulator, transcriptional repressor for nem operon